MLKKQIKKSKGSVSIKKKKRAVRQKGRKLPKFVEKKTTDKSKIVDKIDSVKKRDYIFSVGRRKASVARIRYYKNGQGEVIINGKDFKEYFPYFEFQNTVLEPIILANNQGIGKFTIKVVGGGIRGQAESIRLGISRALLLNDENLRNTLKSKKLLTRDSRVKERKKYGLRKARRAPQWQKR